MKNMTQSSNVGTSRPFVKRYGNRKPRAALLDHREARVCGEDGRRIDSGQQGPDPTCLAGVKRQQRKRFGKPDDQEGTQRKRQQTTDDEDDLPAIGRNEFGGGQTADSRPQRNRHEHQHDHQGAAALRRVFAGECDRVRQNAAETKACDEPQDQQLGGAVGALLVANVPSAKARTPAMTSHLRPK